MCTTAPLEALHPTRLLLRSCFGACIGQNAQLIPPGALLAWGRPCSGYARALLIAWHCLQWETVPHRTAGLGASFLA